MTEGDTCFGISVRDACCNSLCTTTTRLQQWGYSLSVTVAGSAWPTRFADTSQADGGYIRPATAETSPARRLLSTKLEAVMRQRQHPPNSREGPTKEDSGDRPKPLPPSPACTTSSVSASRAVVGPSRAWLAVTRYLSRCPLIYPAIALLLAYLAVLCFSASTTLQARLRPAAHTRLAPAQHRTRTSARSMQSTAGRGALPAPRLARVAALRSGPPRGGPRRRLAAMDVAPPAAFRGPAAHQRAPAAHRGRGRQRLGWAVAYPPRPGVPATTERRRRPYMGTPPARQRRGALLGQDGAQDRRAARRAARTPTPTPTLTLALALTLTRRARPRCSPRRPSARTW